MIADESVHGGDGVGFRFQRLVPGDERVDVLGAELQRRTEIGQRLANISPIRGLASVRAISSTVYKKPFMTAGPATGWVGETDPRTQTASAQ